MPRKPQDPHSPGRGSSAGGGGPRWWRHGGDQLPADGTAVSCGLRGAWLPPKPSLYTLLPQEASLATCYAHSCCGRQRRYKTFQKENKANEENDRGQGDSAGARR